MSWLQLAGLPVFTIASLNEFILCSEQFEVL